ncbi:MAG: FG-GAP repeat domain-containing protein, partial [Crocinitomicaceae bacterium]
MNLKDSLTLPKYLSALFLLFTLNGFSQFLDIEILNAHINIPSDVENFDLDQDGDLDFLVSSRMDRQITWYQNDGNGNYYGQKMVTDDFLSVNAVDAGDIDGDGTIDVIGGSWGGEIKWFSNDGSGNFSLGVLANSTYPRIEDLDVSDLDMDGDLDIVFSTYDSNTLAWCANDGSGNFGPAQVVSSSVTRATAIHAADLDGDGDDDLISFSGIFTGTTIWYMNNGSGSFGPAQVISSVENGVKNIFAADVDNDGDKDVVVASFYGNRIAWYQNGGTGVFGSPIVITTATNGAQRIFLDDLDGDNDLDLVSASFNDDKIAWYENLGGSFGTQTVLTNLADEAKGVNIADVDNDGDKDVVFCSDNDKVGWFENDGTGNFIAEKYVTGSTQNPHSIEVVDLDDDGFVDMLLLGQSEDEVFWFKGVANGQFEPQQYISTLLDNPTSVSSGDLDNDGDKDVIVATDPGFSSEQVGWFENLGGGNFGTFQVVSVVSEGGKAITSDLDGDNDLDILFIPTTLSANFIWFENNGSASFTQAGTLASNITTTDIVTNDMDNDGDQDIVYSTLSDVIWIENLGGGSFASGSELIPFTSHTPVDIATADIDGNGFQDVVLVNAGSDDEVMWYENSGGGVFAGPHVVSLFGDHNNLYTVAPADIEGDGDIDIVATSSFDHKTVWYANDGTGNFGPQQIITTDLVNPKGSLVADLDGDTDLDIISYSGFRDKIVSNQNTFEFEEQLRGRVYYDVNTSGVFDSGDVGMGFASVISTPANDFTYTFADGKYILNFASITGAFVVEPDSIPSWHIVSDSLSYTVVNDSSYTLIDSLDFGFYPDSVFSDLDLSLTGAFPRCNNAINYWINFENQGTNLPSGVIDLELDTAIVFVSAAVSPDSVVNNHVYWHYDSLNLFAMEEIQLVVYMPSFTSIGDTLVSILHINDVDSAGIQIANYADTLSQILACAYDPNDKVVEPAGIGALGYVSPDITELDYTIRFQNTGTDTAFTVVILDQLDANLNWFSLDPIAASDPVHIEVNDTGLVTFTFENIMLPDSNVNELESHGFVRYRINLKENLPVGTSIQNTAQIFFDFNPAIITNTTVNTLYDCDGSFEELIPENPACFASLIEFYDTIPSTILDWSLSGVTSQSGNNLQWVADTTGDFTFSLQSMSNLCLNDTSFQFTVLPEVPSTVLSPIELCFGDSTLIFGQYESTSGNYLDTLTTAFGCDSVIERPLIIYPQVPMQSLADIAICAGDSVAIFGAYQSMAGPYFDTLTTTFGCDSVIQKTLIVYSEE